MCFWIICNSPQCRFRSNCRVSNTVLNTVSQKFGNQKSAIWILRSVLYCLAFSEDL
uniref:Alternative protein ARHGAP42 n=1 Tax=Homo sapiens TaxID=9606 RepID=L8E964_HUMAN|nr:alternative protein ARHGAP42 [Homo sapiens]